MPISPSQALEAIYRAPAALPSHPELLIAGATGALGHAVVRRLVGTQRFAHTQVLACEPIAQGMRRVSLRQVLGDVAQWPPLAQRCDVAVVMFEPPRMYYERERALWTPLPQQLPDLAKWLKEGGVKTLAVVLPHAQGSLPESLKRGLASLDEQALAGLGFERLLIVRSAHKPSAKRTSHPFERLAQWMLGIFQFMVPAGEQPVRPTKVAEIVEALLHAAPAGITVLAQEQVWSLGQLGANALPQALRERFGQAKANHQ
jgi:hypothetical protein